MSIDSVVFRTSPRLSVLNDTQPEPDAQDITFKDSEIRNKILYNFVGARVITDLENSIPLGVGVRLYVGRTPETVYTNPIITVPNVGSDPFQAVAAPVDADGYSSGTETVRREITLTAEDVVKFILEDDDTGSLYSGVRVTIPSTGEEVEVLGTDFINIIAGLEVELLLDITGRIKEIAMKTNGLIWRSPCFSPIEAIAEVWRHTAACDGYRGCLWCNGTWSRVYLLESANLALKDGPRLSLPLIWECFYSGNTV